MIKLVVFMLCVSTLWAHQAKIQSRSMGSRIIGGTPAVAAQFPYAASIYHQTNSGTYFCTGSLITNQWILTAGQCVAGAVLFTIRLGSNSLTANDPNAIRVATDLYLLHPDFDPDTYDNDVGLIQLRLPITFSDYIKPVSVISDIPLPDSSNVYTFGWGQTSDQQPGTVDQLNFVRLVSLSNEECRLTFGNQITDNMVCVDGNLNEGTCRGDLGSALIQYAHHTESYQVGIASFISNKGCESTDPSGFTRVAPYALWINNATAASLNL